jgi:hypothetical protein
MDTKPSGLMTAAPNDDRNKSAKGIMLSRWDWQYDCNDGVCSRLGGDKGEPVNEGEEDHDANSGAASASFSSVL